MADEQNGNEQDSQGSQVILNIQGGGGNPVFQIFQDGTVFGVISGEFKRLDVEKELPLALAYTLVELKEYRYKLGQLYSTLEAEKAALKTTKE